MDSADSLEDKDGAADVQINFPESVMSRIEELMGDTEQFDSPEFDAISYINRMFPTEQSLSGVEAAAARAEWRLAGLRRALAAALRRAPARAPGRAALMQARGVIAELATQVEDINRRASRSESMVREITSEIKQLDCAKWNLTAAITALNHYHMLAGGAEALRTMTDNRQYKEIMLPLQAIMEVLQHFESYRDIAELSALRDQVTDIRRQLARQIYDDVKDAFTAGSKSTMSQKAVADACAVLDLLEHSVRDDLLAWFIDTQLQEYRHLFSSEQEVSWLPHVDRRYSWLKQHLLALERRVASALPDEWRVSERIAMRFCEMTRDELSSLMSARRSEIDVKLLLHAIQKTTTFEGLLHKRFTGLDIEAGDAGDAGAEEVAATEDSAAAPQFVWRGAISVCFEPHLSLYIASLEQTLKALIDRFIQEARQSAAPAAPAPAPAPLAPAGCVLSSCADLFLLYKKCLVQCAQLSTGDAMLQLSVVFRAHLAAYCRLVLGAALPAAAPAPSLGAALHTLLRDDANTPRYSPAEISAIASVLTTAEYCLETVTHLQHKLREKINPDLAAQVDFTHELDLFHKTIDHCIQLLVHDLEGHCEPALQAMGKVPWLHLDAVGDQSQYVTQMLACLKSQVPFLRDSLASSRKYFTQFCIRFANSLIGKFIQALYRCKPVSTVGAEQLLLDTHMLKSALLQLPAVGSAVKRAAPHTYTKVVIKLMTRAEMILKLVMAPLDNNVAGFVAQFVQLLPDATLQEFHKVVDMKGAPRLTKSQQAAADALFKQAMSDRDRAQ